VRREYLIDLYDDEYAASYDAKFLQSPLTKADAEHEVELIGGFLQTARNWLDVACGTGYFLRRFPSVTRAGLDVSPAMLERAREGNEGVPLLLHDFRDPLPAWRDRWSLVTCLWYAYGLVDTLDELVGVIHNLWTWTSPDGLCFVPLADPRLMTGVALPDRVPWGESGDYSRIAAIVWSFVEEDGAKTHSNQIAPTVTFMVEQFQVYFEDVEVIRYPPAFPDWEGRPALVARGKRPLA
jgi:SAM-dependent methyltransferase